MKLETLYNDVVGLLNLQDPTLHNIYYYDIINAINDAIISIRQKYVESGLSDEFAVTETFYFSLRDNDYPFLYSTTLGNKPLKSLPISMVILTANAFHTNLQIPTGETIIPLGEFRVSGDKYYKLTANIDNLETSDKKFKREEARLFAPNSNIQIKAGDIVYDKYDTKKYYIALFDYTLNTSKKINDIYITDDFLSVNNEPLIVNNETFNITVPSTLIEHYKVFEEVYWAEEDTNYLPCVYYPFQRLQETRIVEKDYSAVYSIFKNKLYVTPNVRRFTLTYIPEWSRVEKLEDELEVPDFMIPQIKRSCLNVLGMKLGRNLVDNRVNEQEIENE